MLVKCSFSAPKALAMRWVGVGGSKSLGKGRGITGAGRERAWPMASSSAATEAVGLPASQEPSSAAMPARRPACIAKFHAVAELPKGAEMRRSKTLDYGTVMAKKVQLVSNCTGTQSLRDFGGLYLVHGKYLLEPAVELKAEFASMVDGMPRAAFDDEIRKTRLSLPALEVEFINRDFRDPSLYGILKPVDTSILFEVLLHQENYVSVMQYVASRTLKYICIGQPCLRESTFSLPATASLLQFWPEQLKDVYRTGSFWPKEPEVDRFDTRCWMWGHTTSHLIAIMHGIGWNLEDAEIVDDVCGPNWEYPLLRFVNQRQ
jgi:hypothetical protein